MQPIQILVAAQKISKRVRLEVFMASHATPLQNPEVRADARLCEQAHPPHYSVTSFLTIPIVGATFRN